MARNDPVDHMALLSSLTMDDVVRFFEGVPQQGACPICSQPLVAFTSMRRDEAGMPKQDPLKPAIVKKAVHEPGVDEAPFYLPVIPACCDTCGYMAEFSLAHILEWKAGRHDARQ